MKILVANLGSTSFKFRLFSMTETEEVLLAKGGYERVEDYGQAIDQCLEELQEAGHLNSFSDLDAVGFKTVLGKNLSGCILADEKVLEALDGFREIAPAHNPAYANGIRQFRAKAPELPLVALFETAFYQWATEGSTRYAVPEEWYEAGVRRYGFHGASHKFAAERSAELAGRDDAAEATRNLYLNGPVDLKKPFRVISCHLGGSSSIAGVRNGAAIGASMGLSPQSGLPQNNRVGDLDSSAVPYIAKTLNLSLAEIERQMTVESGLLGLSGVSNDLRDILKAAREGNDRAQLALDVFVHQIRHWIGVFMIELGGCDALVFTGGIGENHAWLREAVCRDLGELGISIDQTRNDSGFSPETDLSTTDSRTRIFTIPANEELVVARETQRLIQSLQTTNS
ncbi:MAG: acetate/propionate family kinase [Opitutaceae bacterium]|nr:acetate/propionate family kinase [Opitutaceae bacterium]